MNATLAIIDSCRLGDVFELDDGEIIVGRQPTCDLVLRSQSVSRQHARIVRRDNACFVEDLGSRNGTYVNGRRVEGTVRLSDRDEIQIFDVTLLFRSGNGDDSHAELFRPDVLRSGDGHRGLVGETVAEIDIFDFGKQNQYANAENKLRAVVELTRNLQLGCDMRQLAPRILESVFRIFPNSARGCLFHVPDCTSRDLVLGGILFRDENNDPTATMWPVSRAAAHQAFSTGKAILSLDPTSRDGDGNGEAARSVFENEAFSLICAPLIGPSRRAWGSIYVDAHSTHARFTEDDLDVLAMVAFIAGQAIEQLFIHTGRYQAVVDTAPDGVVTVDADGVIESVNPAVECLFGYSADDLIGRNIRLLMPELGEGESSGGNFFGAGRETVALRKNGSMLPIQISGGAFELDGEHHYTGIVRDVTQRKRYETELKQLNQTLEKRVQQRTEHVQLLQDVAVIANEADTAESAMQAALARICGHMDWPVGHVYLRSGDRPDEFVDTGIWELRDPEAYDELVTTSRMLAFRPGKGTISRVADRGEAEWNESLKSDTDLVRRKVLLDCGLRASMAFPLFVGDEIVGVVEFFSTHEVEPDPNLLSVMNHVGTQLGRVIERRRFQNELIDAVWSQQRRFGQELHDSLGQQLTGVGMMLDSLAKKLTTENHPCAGRLGNLSGMVQQSKEEARKLSKGMFPVDIDAQGLRSALEELAMMTRERYDVACLFDCDPGFEVSDNNVATHLFRIAQEAVTNAAKHAGGSEIAIALATREAGLELSVADDGCGIEAKSLEGSSGMGLRIMRYRANVVGASLALETNDRGGTTVRCVVERKRDDESSQ